MLRRFCYATSAVVSFVMALALAQGATDAFVLWIIRVRTVVPACAAMFVCTRILAANVSLTTVREAACAGCARMKTALAIAFATSAIFVYVPVTAFAQSVTTTSAQAAVASILIMTIQRPLPMGNLTALTSTVKCISRTNAA